MKIPHYVTKFDTIHSDSSSKKFTARGLVTANADKQQYVTGHGDTLDSAIEDFVFRAATAHDLMSAHKRA